MPWSPFGHVPKKIGREGTPKSDYTVNTARNIEPEKEKKTKMSTIEEKSPEKKVKEKSSYKKLISNLQTTYPDLSQEEALKGILALRVENNGTLTGMTMLEIMERVIQLARPLKGRKREELEPQEYKKTEGEKSISRNGNLCKKNVEVDIGTNGPDATLSHGGVSKIQREDNQKMEAMEQEDFVLEAEETQSKIKNKDEETYDPPAQEEEETPRKRRENLINKKALEQRRKKKEMEREREPSLESVDDLLLSEKGEESDASGQSELLRKSKVRRKKSSPKKNEEKEDQAHSDSDTADEESETLVKVRGKRKDTVEITRTPSKPRERKNAIEEENKDDEAEESYVPYNPDPPYKTPQPKKKTSSKHTDIAQDEETLDEVEVKSAKKSTKKSKKPANNDEMVESMLEELDEAPRSSRKRKIPSYLREFAVEDTKIVDEESENSVKVGGKRKERAEILRTPSRSKGRKNAIEEENEDEKVLSENGLIDDEHEPEIPRSKSSKRRRIEDDLEPETPKKRKVDEEFKTPKKKRNSSVKKSSLTRKVVPIPSEYGECVLCGLMFDEESTKFGMADKTRETGQTFADILFGLFHEESLPPSLAEKAKAVDLDMGNLCTLCVSHVDQLDVFQQKVTDIKTSIISIFMQKTRNDSLNHGEIESEESDDSEETKVVVQVTPKKKAKKSKSGKLVTLVYQSPLKKVKDLEAMSDKEISKMTETVIKYTPRKSTTKAMGIEEDKEKEVNEDEIEPQEDGDLAKKLSVLSGIEIKKINNETGDESLQISGLAGIEIKKVGDSSDEKKTPSKKKSPKKEKSPRKTPAKKRTPKKGKNASIEVEGEPVFEEASEALKANLDESMAEPTELAPEQAGESIIDQQVPQDAIKPNIPASPGGVRMSPGRGGRGGARGAGRGGRGMIRPNNFVPMPPKSKKSLFELSQNKRKMGTLITNNGISVSPMQNTSAVSNYRMNGTQATATPFIGTTVQTLHVPVTPLPVPTPVTLTQAPVTLIQAPVTLIADPVTFTPAPVTFTPAPVTFTPAQMTFTPAPRAPTPAPVTLTPSKLNGLSSISITKAPSKDTTDIATPVEVKEKKAYKKLIAKIQSVHPDMSHEEAMSGIVALRAANNGTLTGMSMQEIITRVRENVRGKEEETPMETATETETSNSLPIGEEFEKIINSPPLQPEQPAPPNMAEKTEALYEINCKFCSRLFKSSSETATQKVYDMHIQEHEKETRTLFEKEVPVSDQPSAADPATAADTPSGEQGIASENDQEPDPVKSEKSYCKPCTKQFKSAKQYGLHQNTEHAAEIEFEKIMSPP